MDSGQDHCRIIIHHHGIQDVSRNLSFPQFMDDPIFESDYDQGWSAISESFKD